MNLHVPRQPINFADKFSRFGEHWSPRVIAEMNDYQFKLVKVQGEFVWHQHEDTDEVFIVIDGELVLLNVETGVYFGLNRTGTKIWDLIGQTADIDAVLEGLKTAYPIDPEILRQDLLELVAGLEKEGLVSELRAS